MQWCIEVRTSSHTQWLTKHNHSLFSYICLINKASFLFCAPLSCVIPCHLHSNASVILDPRSLPASAMLHTIPRQQSGGVTVQPIGALLAVWRAVSSPPPRCSAAAAVSWVISSEGILAARRSATLCCMQMAAETRVSPLYSPRRKPTADGCDIFSPAYETFVISGCSYPLHGSFDLAALE